MALRMSADISLLTLAQFAVLANDEPLTMATLDRMTSLAQAPAGA